MARIKEKNILHIITDPFNSAVSQIVSKQNYATSFTFAHKNTKTMYCNYKLVVPTNNYKCSLLSLKTKIICFTLYKEGNLVVVINTFFACV